MVAPVTMQSEAMREERRRGLPRTPKNSVSRFVAVIDSDRSCSVGSTDRADIWPDLRQTAWRDAEAAGLEERDRHDRQIVEYDANSLPAHRAGAAGPWAPDNRPDSTKSSARSNKAKLP